MTKLIETGSCQGSYGPKTVAIVETNDGQRLFVSQGYGGEGTHNGGAERWRHGYAMTTKDSDTIESLFDTVDWPMLKYHGEDDGRKILDLDGIAIQAMADSAGI